ncbi:hypothetical protein CcrBL47_gp385 [Caulobacter phage BL47]|nr:hypothetical protein CcrBL47_gp385 [Caulobacter phage BL47]
MSPTPDPRQQDDLFTHRLAWRAALVDCLERGKNDEASRSYWKHELKVFDHVFHNLEVNRSPHLQIGQQVRIRLDEDAPWTSDWQNQTYWIVGVRYWAEPYGPPKLSYDLSEVWPPKQGSITTEFDDQYVREA